MTDEIATTGDIGAALDNLSDQRDVPDCSNTFCERDGPFKFRPDTSSTAVPVCQECKKILLA